MKSYINKIISVLMCITMIFAIAVPLCVPVSSEGTETTETSGLEMTKSYDASTGLLTLVSYVTGETITQTITKINPTDVVLVLDTTSSMEWDCNVATKLSHLDSLCKDYADSYKYHTGLFSNKDVRWNEINGYWEYDSGGWTKITEVTSSKYIKCDRLTALKGATTEFIRTISASSPDSRVGIVTFGSGDSQAIIKNELTYCNEDGKNALLSTISGLSADNASTAQSTGLKRGLSVFDLTSTRQKTMILFTDGEPVAEDYNKGIIQAKEVKDNGVTLYTVGIFSSVTDEITTYMNYMSSKYPSVTSMETSKPASVDGEYYYLVNDSNSLGSILQQISETIISQQAKIQTLDSKTVLKDIISEKFSLDKENDKKVHIYTSAYIGENQWAAPVEVGQADGITYTLSDEKTVDVKGFDYSANWCGLENINGKNVYRGKRLIVTIPIKPADGAQGESGVNTNDPGSGIIPTGEEAPLQNFPVPTTDLPTDIKIIKRFDGDYIPSGKTFELAASVTDCITGYLPADADNYTKATTAPNSYDNIVLGKDGVYDGVKNILVKSDKRSSSVTVTEKAVPAGYTVTIASGDVSETFTGTGADVSKTFDVTADMEITVTNKKLNPDTTNVTVEEYVTGYGDINKSFSFDASYNSAGTPETDNFSIKNGETHSLEDVDVTKDGTVIIKPETVEGYTTKVMVGETEYFPDKDGKYTIPVVEDMKIKVIHDKASPDTADIDFKMFTGGNMGDKTQQFTVTGTSDDFSYKMKHGDTEKLADIAIGSTVKFKVDAPEDYTGIKVIVNDKEVTPVNGEYIFDVDGDTTVSITCSRDAVIDTGIMLDSLPYVIIVIMVVLGISAIIIRKKKRE